MSILILAEILHQVLTTQRGFSFTLNKIQDKAKIHLVTCIEDQQLWHHGHYLHAYENNVDQIQFLQMIVKNQKLLRMVT